MKNIILEKIANALTEDGEYFYATDELDPRDINIEIEGLGKLTFPLNHAVIQELINISSKAQFGLREQTLLDENIRNTQEISSSKLHITINEYSLTHMLDKMRDSLGLAENSVLIPHLHNMLIYASGQFFDMHQDSEKLENMVGTLVVVLPSSHIGGDLIIEHGKKDHIFSSENFDLNNVKCIAFYADCKHKVEKVKQGHRIALTYNLVLKSEKFNNLQNINQQLKNAIAVYFAIESEEQPQKLVYFLNHSYTEHSLRWNMLKGDDRTNASAIYLVAQKLGLISHLALVEILQSWSTHGNEDNPEIDELVNDEITLSYWLDKDNKKMSFNDCNIGNNEICWTKETESFEPFKTEYEGYTGNYGNSMDYWYRRAAIVLWQESSKIPINFMLNYDNSIKELCEIKNVLGNEKKVVEIIEKAGKYLYQKCYQNERSDFDMLINIALYIKDKDMALSILSHFSWKILNSDIAELLAKLQIQYGVSWCINLLNSWKNHEKHINNCILNAINSFVHNFLGYKGEAQIVELLLNVQSSAFIHKDKQTHKWQKPVELRKSLPKRIEMLYQIFVACATIWNVEVADKVLEHVISNPELYTETSLADLFLKLQDVIPSKYFVHYKLLKNYLVQAIDSIVALGMRAEDDWSIGAQLPCKCEHCKIANNFLHSKTEIKKIWPIVTAIRKHIMRTFEGLDLPIEQFQR